MRIGMGELIVSLVGLILFLLPLIVAVLLIVALVKYLKGKK